ncbi:MAG: ADP-forming succinate--CoA ligase subunit beta [Planctomycetes bacterium]|nr:ADP-forming succinate--CoA ligase subunit beta [Planctomycetota bacterium]MBI3835538.1 ADP-forming succinate--CoA ligase subunit beta [Planctomycetota bacterium]
MKVHEYQARQLLADAGVPVPKSQVVESVDAAIKAYSEIGGQAVVKAQVFAGGRGKAGFVKLVNSADEARKAADFMLKNRMVSPQTGAAGIAVKKLLIAAAVDIESEYYAAVVLDRAKRVPVVMVSREGGVEIEVVAHRNPDAIIKRWLHPTLGLLDFQCNQLVAALGFTDKEQMKSADAIIRGLVDVFYKYDCSLAEINPLVRTKSGQVMAIDAKMNFDDNAIFRHKVLQEMFDPTEENPMELRAKEHNLSYIALDGNIGCLVNGAGLAMATMDIIKLHGGEPANFLDVGGSVTKDGAIEAFRIILSDNKVRGILVNIFGGIAKCDTIAEALIAAAKEIGFKVPVVVRLEGTNVDRARQLLKEAALPVLIPAADLTDAAKKVCAKVA